MFKITIDENDWLNITQDIYYLYDRDVQQSFDKTGKLLPKSAIYCTDLSVKIKKFLKENYRCKIRKVKS